MLEEANRMMVQLRELYAQLDKAAAEAVVKLKATCKLGCDGCCYQVAVASVPEGMLMAERVLTWPDWREWIEKLALASQGYLKPMSRREHFCKKVPCVFLDTEKHQCRLYDARPGACRYQYVASPPEQCFPESLATETMNLNLMMLEGMVWKFAKECLSDELGVSAAPIPLSGLFGIGQWLLLNDRKEDTEFFTKTTEELPDPTEWAKKAVDGLLTDIDADNAAVQEIRKVAKQLGF